MAVRCRIKCGALRFLLKACLVEASTITLIVNVIDEKT